jgi:hypothetical protein
MLSPLRRCSQRWRPVVLLVLVGVIVVVSIKSDSIAHHALRLGGVIQSRNPLQLDFSRMAIMASRPREETHSEGCDVALCMGITTREARVETNDDIAALPIISSSLRSLVQTGEENVRYCYYLAYDQDDPLLSKDSGRRRFVDVFEFAVSELDGTAGHDGTTSHANTLSISVDLAPTNMSGSPSRAHNIACMAAYDHGAEYFFKLNDDVFFLTSGWTGKLIASLARPPFSNFGVVGPYFTEGNEDNLEVQFFHRTHIDIFGYVIPFAYTDWGAESWFTRVYAVNGFACKVREVSISHQIWRFGHRYHVKTHRNATRESADRSWLFEKGFPKVRPRDGHTARTYPKFASATRKCVAIPEI